MERRYDAAEQRTEEGDLLFYFERLDDRGADLQGVWGFKRRWTTGLRYDRFDGGDPTDSLRDGRDRWSANLTFYPSENSKLRLPFNWDDPEHLDQEVQSLFFQFELLYGAHGGHQF